MNGKEHKLISLRQLLVSAVEQGDAGAAIGIATAMAMGWSGISGPADMDETTRLRVYNPERRAVFKGTIREFLDMLSDQIHDAHAELMGHN